MTHCTVVKLNLALGILLFCRPTPQACAVAVEWSQQSGGNGHSYEYILALGTWQEAVAAASALRFDGIPGHLATVTSSAENQFIAENLLRDLSEIEAPFIGGFQPPGSFEPDGDWRWITGEPFVYTNWRGGEPNNTYGGGHPGNIPFGASEEVLHFQGTFWNDLPAAAQSLGYIVEFSPELVSPLAGDYNANGRVEQADLDLVLLNWGDHAFPPPPSWLADLPTGLIDQNELDAVLLNWGNGAALSMNQAASVPEPSGLLLLALIGPIALVRRTLATTKRLRISPRVLLLCKVRSSILCLLAAAHVHVECRASQIVFDAATDFRIGSNPNGPWRYGWSEGLGTTVHLFTDLRFFDELVRLGDGGNFANVHYNTSGRTVIAGPTYPPFALTFHPGANGQFGVVRWTAPDKGNVQFDATFTGIHFTTTDIHILHNGLSLFADEIRSFGESVSFSTNPTGVLLPVNMGDVIDFAVGFGFDDNYEQDLTQIDVQVYFSSSLAGDCNDNGRVEQADLDLVLLNWGSPATHRLLG